MEQFNWSDSTVDLPSVSASETVDVDTGPPSKIDVIGEVDYLKGIKAAGPEELLSAFFKDSSR